jgi:hypothetical protein
VQLFDAEIEGDRAGGLQIIRVLFATTSLKHMFYVMDELAKIAGNQAVPVNHEHRPNNISSAKNIRVMAPFQTGLRIESSQPRSTAVGCPRTAA